MTFEPHADLPPSLYKYASEAATLAILENSSLQISKPSLFNDLLDMNATLRIEIDNVEDVVERILDQLFEGLYGSAAVQLRNAYGRGIALMRMLFSSPPDPQRWRDDMRPDLLAQVRDHATIARTLSNQLAEHLATSKVLCFSASGTNAPMWGTYASSLEGAVLQFTPSTEESCFRAALPVSYDGPPLLLDQQQFIDWMSGRLALTDIDLFTRFVFTKAPEWAYEQEWRLFFGEGQHQDQDREYKRFNPDDLEAVIVGSRMKEDALDKVISLVAEHYRQATVRRINLSPNGVYVVENL